MLLGVAALSEAFDDSIAPATVFRGRDSERGSKEVTR
jgi:hypothetical protein